MADDPTDTPDADETATDEVNEATDEVVDADIVEAEIVDAEPESTEATSDETDESDEEATSDADEDAGTPGAESSGGSTGSGSGPSRPVVRRKIVSKRVTPKGGGPARSTGPATRRSVDAARKRSGGKTDDGLLVMEDEPSFAERYQAAAKLPSPTWVPVLMFALLIVGALIIILNYMNAFGDPSNVRLLIGLVFILGGIITATQYR